MLPSWIVIIPPLVVVFCALYTQNVIASFLIGVAFSALIATKGNVFDAFWLSGKRFLSSSGLNKLGSWPEFWGNWNLFIFLFLILLGSIIVLLQTVGASNIFARVMSKYVKNKYTAQKASLLLSFLFFIDDYFSVLTVGSVMRSLARLYGLNPIKLAFLVTAVATPLTILSPVSSWVGEVILQLKLVGVSPGNGINADPYLVFLKAIPFILYALLMIMGAWYIVIRSISYGPMQKYDKTNEKISAAGHPNNAHSCSSLSDFLIPILSLIILVFIGFLYTGDYILFGGNNNLGQAIQNTVPHQALFAGGLLSLLISFFYFWMRCRITIFGMIQVIREGFFLMFPSILMLVCAWTFGALLRYDLHTGDYVASLFVLFIKITFLPVICFLFAALISCMIGSAWATIGIIVPIVVPMLQQLSHVSQGTSADAIPLLFPVVGAALSGAIMGTHVSLISDNPIMSSASTGANHYEHVKTMTWYVIPIALATAASYTLVGILIPHFSLPLVFIMSLLSGMITMVFLLECFQHFFHK